MDLIQQLNWRYATKGYDASKKLSTEQVATLKEVLRLSPSSYGLQPYKFVHVKNPELRAKLKEVSWGQSQVTDASDLFVLCRIDKMDEAYINKFIELTAKTRGQDVASLAGFKQMLMGPAGQSDEMFAVWAAKQVYLALGNLLTSCALLEIDATPMEGFDPAKYDEILDLPAKGLHSVVVCAVGTRSPEDKYATEKKVRFPMEELFVTIE